MIEIKSKHLPDFCKKRIIEAYDSSINPKGMHVGPPKMTLHTLDIYRMIKIIEALEEEIRQLKENK